MVNLSNEQQLFINKVKEGYNILVDACIGSGKTTAIQALCNILDNELDILYLTYNKLLKIDAKNKIQNKNVEVTNYHGFAYGKLRQMGISPGVSDSIQLFNKYHPKLKYYDIIILDEYQDINQEISEMLVYIKNSCPGVQIIAVGDMDQKLYDWTTLDVYKFINEFLGKDCLRLEFTQCFRLCKKHAAYLGRMWEKKIVGVNKSCEIRRMNFTQVINFLANCNPKDVLCLGSNYGDMSKTLNLLEKDYPEKYNKKTIYANIRSIDSSNTILDNDVGIFTTYDSAKGLERPICVVFDFTNAYWLTRLSNPGVNYKILKNIFLVAASRGKQEIIFVEDVINNNKKKEGV